MRTYKILVVRGLSLTRLPLGRSLPQVRAYADFVVRGLGLQAQTHYAQPRPARTVTVTYMARRASAEWPEKVQPLTLALTLEQP